MLLKKSERVAQYIKQMVYEIDHISHSVGLKELRGLDIMHARMMGDDGVAVELTSLYPYPDYHLNSETMRQRLKETKH